MKLFNCLLITAAFASSLCLATPVKQGNTEVEERNRGLTARAADEYTYPTKFGDIKFIRADGVPGEPADSITLNGEVLMSTKGQVDKQGQLLYLMSESETTTSREKMPRRAGQIGRTETKRMVVLVGQGTCIKKLAVFDFTGPKPFISQQFGNDREDRICLTFRKAKWGMKETEITLNSGATYIYEAQGTVSGPFVIE
jgi:hypothetical protein